MIKSICEDGQGLYVNTTLFYTRDFSSQGLLYPLRGIQNQFPVDTLKKAVLNAN